MKILKDIWKTFQKPIILLAAFILVLLVVLKIVPAIKESAAEDSPVTKIIVTNNNTYAQGEEIAAGDFEVIAVHKNGAKTAIDTDKVKLSKTTPDPTGSITEVKVSAEGQSCRVKVKNERNKIVTFECGNPDVSAVKAVLYSNGELSFEGVGDILAFTNAEFPWKSYEGDDDYPVKAVTFEETVTPSSMDGYFTEWKPFAMSKIYLIPSKAWSIHSLAVRHLPVRRIYLDAAVSMTLQKHLATAYHWKLHLRSLRL